MFQNPEPGSLAFDMWWFEYYTEGLFQGCKWAIGQDGSGWIGFGGSSGMGYIDCSRLIWRLFQHQGKDYPYRNCPTFVEQLSAYFTQVTFPQPGDIILWGTHHMALFVEWGTCYSTRSSNVVSRWHTSIFDNYFESIGVHQVRFFRWSNVQE